MATSSWSDRSLHYSLVETLVPEALLATPVTTIDGKTTRQSHERWHGIAALHTVTAWATEARVALGQRSVADHANEITALPDLLERVVANGAVITMGAMERQRNLSAQIVAAEADYELALSLKAKLQQAGWDDPYLATVMGLPLPPAHFRSIASSTNIS